MTSELVCILFADRSSGEGEAVSVDSQVLASVCQDPLFQADDSAHNCTLTTGLSHHRCALCRRLFALSTHGGSTMGPARPLRERRAAVRLIHLGLGTTHVR